MTMSWFDDKENRTMSWYMDNSVSGVVTGTRNKGGATACQLPYMERGLEECGTKGPRPSHVGDKV